MGQRSVALLIALAIYAGIGAVFGFAFGFGHKSPQAFALGAILIFGVAYLVARASPMPPMALTRKTAIYASAAAIGYFALQTTADMADVRGSARAAGARSAGMDLDGARCPELRGGGWAQALFPLWHPHPAAAGLRGPLSNGLYANATIDRCSRLVSPCIRARDTRRARTVPC